MSQTDDTPPIPDLERVVTRLAAPTCIMTSMYEDVRAGVRVRSAQMCADDPPLVSVAVRRGHAIDPLIRDSHAFALLLVDPEDRMIARKFPPPDDAESPLPGNPDANDEERSIADAFSSFQVITLKTGSPVVTRCLAALDCEVVRHFDIEAETEVYIGQVVAARSFAG